MDIQNTAQLLGNFGEFVGAIAVVVTLVYLSLQVRQGKKSLDANTEALESARRISLAQVYQSRTQLMQDHLLDVQNSDYMPQVLSKYYSEGLDSLTPVERIRFHYGMLVIMNQLDNLHYQFMQGFLDEESYEHDFKEGVRRQAPVWDLLGLTPRRPSFRDEVERIKQHVNAG